jgi:uncharacterized coiled-coil protein SlyX
MRTHAIAIIMTGIFSRALVFVAMRWLTALAILAHLGEASSFPSISSNDSVIVIAANDVRFVLPGTSDDALFSQLLARLAALETLSGQISTLNAQMATQADQIAALNGQVATQNDQIATLNEQVATLTAFQQQVTDAANQCTLGSAVRNIRWVLLPMHGFFL